MPEDSVHLMAVLADDETGERIPDALVIGFELYRRRVRGATDGRGERGGPTMPLQKSRGLAKSTYEHLIRCSYIDANDGVAVTEGDVVGLDVCVTAEDPLPEHAGEWAISPEEAEALASLFGLLADPTRARILYALVEAGEVCVGDLAETVEAEESTVSHALRLLRIAEVVRSRREGRHVFYRLDDVHVRLLLDVSREHLRHSTTGEHRRASAPAREGAGRG